MTTPEAPATSAATEVDSEDRRDVLALVVRFALAFGLVAMLVFFSLKTPLFLTTGNLTNIALSSSVLLIVAVPSAVLVVMGYVDLSVGSTLALSGVSAGLLIESGWPWFFAVAAAIAVGAVVGMINGALVTFLGLSAIIVTLGGMQLIRGIGESLTALPPSGFGDGMAILGRGLWLGVPMPVWIALLVFVIGASFLYLTASGRHVYAIGVNPQAAFLSGLKTKRLPLFAFAATGAAAGLGGALTAARLDSAPPTTLALNFEIQVLSAVLLGGIAFAGGRGTMGGVLLGVAFLGVLQNGLVLLSVSSSGQKLATGTALVIAAGLEALSARRSGGRIRVRGTRKLIDTTTKTTKDV